MGIIGSYQGYTDSPLYLFSNGVWGNLQTTGVTFTAGRGGEYKEPGGFYFDGNGICRLKQTVNLSAYNYVKSDIYTAGDVCGIGISQRSDVISKESLTVFATAKSAPILNITNISGDYYLYFFNEGAYTNSVTNNIFLTTV